MHEVSWYHIFFVDILIGNHMELLKIFKNVSLLHSWNDMELKKKLVKEGPFSPNGSFSFKKESSRIIFSYKTFAT